MFTTINKLSNKSHYFDHDADIGIIGFGKTIPEAFVSAAQAMFALMSDPQEIKPKITITFEFQETDIEFALVIWLNLLITYAHKDKLVFNSFELSRHGGYWQGTAIGEPWRKQLTRGTEVKGATLTALSVKKIDNVWQASCVVDV